MAAVLWSAGAVWLAIAGTVCAGYIVRNRSEK